MFKLAGRLSRTTLPDGRQHTKQISTFGVNLAKMGLGKKLLLASGGVITTTAIAIGFALERSLKADELELHPPKYPWAHKSIFASYDASSLRRGWQVYKQVCAACHSLRFVSYREFIDIFMSENEAKAEAAEVQIEDGPDAEGKMFMRPGKISDIIPSPYPNEEAARAANNGAYPPDLSYIVPARHGAEDYIFALLTGYMEAPAGITIQEGQHFNPYFAGGAIGMAQAIYNDSVEFSDGTPPSASQIAKDVTTFLSWCSAPEHDYRKRFAIKATMLLGIAFFSVWYWKRHQWVSIKTRKVFFRQK